MNKAEAISKMQQGHKITHRNFSHDEWMTMSNGKIVLEDGVKCLPGEFWSLRNNESWNEGYELFLTKA